MLFPNWKEILMMRNRSALLSTILILLGIVYLALVAYIFISRVNLAGDRTLQYLLHPIILSSAITYVLFVDALYERAVDKVNARPALVFAAGFAIPVLIGRCIGLMAISSSALFTTNSLLNFYSSTSISMTIEVAAWTTFFPISMFFLGRLFFPKNRILGLLCFASSACCLIAFGSFFTTSMVFLLIGIIGWGLLFLLVVTAYLISQIHEYQAQK